MEDMIHDNYIEYHWRIFFEDNGRVNNEKEILRVKRWEVYINKEK